ncbi:hypothetical protein OGAPHI_006160 [Ogataea philodendri]|uniref:Protein-lysine N-methyltransferase EFM2 n=1 Tax=Ogataea philodendri TaxID=1378263 RepID=A0A9P8T0Y9_9ASCO|nr:uncharacterized protein OGAPHI_006160 [Ogataea philodendri]KAH3661981.1 hypothetical protein OGAPHI_006160 [Ogataea philodendri]
MVTSSCSARKLISCGDKFCWYALGRDIQTADCEPVVIDQGVDESETPGLHVLDLPQLAYKPPFTVLLIVLQLLKNDEVCNFGQQTGLKPLDTVKSECPDEFSQTVPWLQTYSSLFYQNISQLDQLSTADIVSYLTNIVSSPLKWLDPEHREKVWALASGIISEKSGRTAAPGFTRNITVPGLPPINLYEPALTSDNLGLKTWGSSLMLSRRLASLPKLKEPILELGAGTGLVGISCGLLGYSDVILTDLPEIVPNLDKNVQLNNLKLQCSVLDWTNPQGFADNSFPTIILSDPIYSADHPTLVRNMVQKFLALNNAQLLIQIPLRQRYEEERANLWSLIDGLGLKEHTCIQEEGYDDFGEQSFLFKIYQR